MTEERRIPRRISDKEVYDAIDALKENEEGSLEKALIAQLALGVDTRAFLRKLYKELIPARKKTYTDPLKTKKDEDVVTG